MAILFVQHLAFHNNEDLPNSTNITKVGSKLCPILNTPSKMAEDFLKCCQSGEISLNLVP